MKPGVRVGSVIRITVADRPMTGMLAIVEELEGFGVQAYSPMDNGSRAYIRLAWHHFEDTGGMVEATEDDQ